MYECFVSANTRTTSLLMRLEDCPPAHSLHMHACILPHALHNACPLYPSDAADE